jgi:hypothetical protein
VVEQRYEIRILLVEDDTLVRLGLTVVLNAMTDLKVIGSGVWSPGNRKNQRTSTRHCFTRYRIA